MMQARVLEKKVQLGENIAQTLGLGCYKILGTLFFCLRYGLFSVQKIMKNLVCLNTSQLVKGGDVTKCELC